MTLQTSPGRHTSSMARAAVSPLENRQPRTSSVQSGRSYRVRAINGSGYWELRLQIEGHSLQVIMAEHSNLLRTPVASLLLGPGERADALLDVDQPPGSYWTFVSASGRSHVSLAVLLVDPAGGAAEWPGIPAGETSPPPPILSASGSERSLALLLNQPAEAQELLEASRTVRLHLTGTMKPYR